MIKRDETKQSISTNHGLLDQVSITGREPIFLFQGHDQDASGDHMLSWH
jgi:hypothetical protein